MFNVISQRKPGGNLQSEWFYLKRKETCSSAVLLHACFQSTAMKQLQQLWIWSPDLLSESILNNNSAQTFAAILALKFRLFNFLLTATSPSVVLLSSSGNESSWANQENENPLFIQFSLLKAVRFWGGWKFLCEEKVVQWATMSQYNKYQVALVCESYPPLSHLLFYFLFFTLIKCLCIFRSSFLSFSCEWTALVLLLVLILLAISRMLEEKTMNSFGGKI